MFLVQILCISTPNDTVFWTKYRTVTCPVFWTRGSTIFFMQFLAHFFLKHGFSKIDEMNKNDVRIVPCTGTLYQHRTIRP